jgi:hypothetical protein
MSNTLNYAVVNTLNVVTNIVVGTEEFAVQYQIENPTLRLVIIPEYNELDPSTHVIVEQGCLHDGLAFQRGPRQLDEEKKELKRKAYDAFMASNLFVQIDLWENYTAEQKAAWTTYRATLRNIDAIVDAEGFDIDTYTLPSAPI